MTIIVANGVSYDFSNIRLTYSNIQTAGTGQQLPKIVAAFVDVLADCQKRQIAYSTSSVAISTGAKSFTLVGDVPFTAGNYIQMIDVIDPSANNMYGRVSSYNPTTQELSVLVTSDDKINGSGTKTAWVILGGVGERGAVGSATLDIDAYSSTTALDLDTDDVFVVSVDGDERKITTAQMRKWIALDDFTNIHQLSGEVTNGTYDITRFVPVGYKVVAARAISEVGTCTLALRNDTTATAFTHTPLAVTTSGVTQSVTDDGDNEIDVGETMSVVVTDATGDLENVDIWYQTRPL